MQNLNSLVRHLRNTIGQEVVYKGARYIIVELLEEPLSLVIQSLESQTTIQDNQFGSPQRRVTQLISIPCIDDIDQDILHKEFLALNLGLE